MNETALKERLKVIAKENGITFNDCWRQLLLERLLLRVSKSKYAEKLIFKGGFLLAYSLELGRETVDLDFLLRKLRASEDEVQTMFEKIIAIEAKDGFVFKWDGIDTLAQPHMKYPGYRVHFEVLFGKMKDKVQVDLGIGDAVTPQKMDITLFEYKGKPIFEEQVTMLAYPLETVFAEKLDSIISRGSKNSRMKDYHDLLLLIRSKALSEKKVVSSVEETFSHRGTKINIPISFADDQIESIQRLWSAHIRGLKNIAAELKMPSTIKEVHSEINLFLKTIGLGA